MATVVADGRPPAGTKVKVIRAAGGRNRPGDIVYVKSNQNYVQYDELLVTHRLDDIDKDGDGNYICEYEIVQENCLDRLTESERQKVTDAVLDAATKRGYCDETKKILSDLGLPTERTLQTEKITVEIEYTVKPGYTFVSSNLLYNDQWTKDGRPVIQITSAKKV